MPGSVVLRLAGVGLTEGSTQVLSDIDWSVSTGERWVVLGPNGAGKTSLLRIASLYRHPSSGELDVLGQRLGRTDVRTLRQRIGLASHALTDQLRTRLSALDVVMTARYGALEPWWHTYTEDDRADALRLLDRFDLAARADHIIGTLSSGERQRLLLARAFAGEPGLVLLDEPTAGLDVGGREDLVVRLAALASDPELPPMVLVTHHVEEIPPGFTHALLLAGGRVQHAGPLDDVVTTDHLSTLFGLDLDVVRRDGRFAAWAKG